MTKETRQPVLKKLLKEYRYFDMDKEQSIALIQFFIDYEKLIIIENEVFEKSIDPKKRERDFEKIEVISNLSSLLIDSLYKNKKKKNNARHT